MQCFVHTFSGNFYKFLSELFSVSNIAQWGEILYGKLIELRFSFTPESGINVLNYINKFLCTMHFKLIEHNKIPPAF